MLKGRGLVFIREGPSPWNQSRGSGPCLKLHTLSSVLLRTVPEAGPRRAIIQQKFHPLVLKTHRATGTDQWPTLSLMGGGINHQLNYLDKIVQQKPIYMPIMLFLLGKQRWCVNRITRPFSDKNHIIARSAAASCEKSASKFTRENDFEFHMRWISLIDLMKRQL